MNPKEPQPPLTSFDFVGDEGLRASLARDAEELTIASRSGAHKSTVVLAGSIIETVLLDHLVSTDHAQRTGRDPTKFEFAKLIDTCHDEGVISDRTKHLLHAVRDYRNLIHPGRSLRLKDQVTSASAAVAQGVVGIICTEIAERPNRRFGMTAEQVLTKVRHDNQIIDMLDHILKQLRPSELDRLVVHVVPQAFLEIPEDDPDTERCIRALYRAAFTSCSDDGRIARLDRLGHAIQNDAGWTVRSLLTHTFVGWHLQYARPETQRLVSDRLIVESKGSTPPFPQMTYLYLLNALPLDTAMKFVEEVYSYARHWSDDGRKRLTNVLLTDPQWDNFPLGDEAQAADHYKELISRLKLRAEKTTEGQRQWLEEIVRGSEFPF
jgi:hypothetical protein